MSTAGASPVHGDLLYEGKAKRVFASDRSDRVMVEFKNDATAFNAQKKAQLEDKGRLNCQISARLFELLEAKGIPSHYVGLASDTWMVVQRVEIIPLEVVLRNVATGSLCRQTPIEEGTAIEWVRVHMSPDYAYFNHAPHLSAGVGCNTCHGRIDQMEVVTQNQPLSMSWCLDCHRNPGPNLRPPEEVTNMSWDPATADYHRQTDDEGRPMDASGTRTLVPPNNCGGCHR